MTQLQYTPEQINGFTVPQMACLLSEKPPGEKKVESQAEWQRIAEEEARRQEEWTKG